MEQIVVYDRLGNPKFDLLRQEPLRTITSAQLQMQHMANDYISISIQSADPLSFTVGDYIEIRSRRYSIRSVADITVQSAYYLQYTLTLYGVMYDLMRYTFRNAASNDLSDTDTFSLTLPLVSMVQTIVDNCNRAGDTSWQFDPTTCPSTDPQTISFDSVNCLSALQTITNDFDVEFRILQNNGQKTLQVGTFGTYLNQNAPLQYGLGLGIQQLQESKVDDSTPISRLLVQGSTENILSPYRNYSQRLQLPLQRLSLYPHTLDDGTIVPIGTPIGIPTDQQRYITEEILLALDPTYPTTNLTARIGTIESTLHLDDIYPTRTYTITQKTDRLRFQSTDIDFDLMAHWSMSLADFQEYCILHSSTLPTQQQFDDCQLFASTQGATWQQYQQYLVSSPTRITYYQWRAIAGLPPLPPSISFNQTLYEYYDTLHSKVLANETKYMTDNANVCFIDGLLAGQNFTIKDYNHASHTLTINAYTESDTGTLMPSADVNGPFRTTVGDKFKITGIYMPYTYYQEAEERLWFAAVEKFQQVKSFSYRYTLTIDPLFVKKRYDDNTESLSPLFSILQPGDYLTLTESRIGVNNLTARIASVDIDLTQGHAPCTSFRIILQDIHKLRTRYDLPAPQRSPRYDYTISDQMRQRTTNLEHTTDTISTITTQQQQRLATITSDLQTTEQATEENAQAIQATSQATQDNALAIHENRNTLAQQGQTIASHQETLTFHEQRIAYLEAHLPK